MSNAVSIDIYYVVHLSFSSRSKGAVIVWGGGADPSSLLGPLSIYIRFGGPWYLNTRARFSLVVLMLFVYTASRC